LLKSRGYDAKVNWEKSSVDKVCESQENKTLEIRIVRKVCSLVGVLDPFYCEICLWVSWGIYSMFACVCVLSSFTQT